MRGARLGNALQQPASGHGAKHPGPPPCQDPLVRHTAGMLYRADGAELQVRGDFTPVGGRQLVVDVCPQGTPHRGASPEEFPSGRTRIGQERQIQSVHDGEGTHGLPVRFRPVTFRVP